MPHSIGKAISFGLLALCFLQSRCLADRNHLGFGFENQKESVTIPFKNINNLIVLEAVLDDKTKLNLILDTGIRSIVLFNESYVPEISDYTFQIKFTGTGLRTAIPAKVSTGHNLRLSEDVIANQINVVLLKRSNNNLHQIKGHKIHGAFGYQLFSRFQVKIDFEHEIIILSEPYKSEQIKGYMAVPLIMHDTKPFVAVEALNAKSEWHPLQMILDLGANHKILLHRQKETESLIAPNLEKNRIAEGLNGSIYGYKSAIAQIKLGSQLYATTDILIPTITTYHQESMEIKKHGSIGSKFFANQTIIIDYVNERLFIKIPEKNVPPLHTHQKIKIANPQPPSLN
jgi:hypothetical protein